MSVQFPPGIDQRPWVPPANAIKILLMGEGGVGRTTLAFKYVSGVFYNNTQMTIGIQYHLKNIKFDGKIYALSLWDLAGQDRFRFMHPSYVKGAKGAIFFYDMTRSRSLDNIEEWVNIARTEDKNLPVMMCGLKIDLVKEREVESYYARSFLELLGLFDYMEPSSKSGKDVELVFETLVRKIAGLPKKPTGKEASRDMAKPPALQIPVVGGTVKPALAKTPVKRRPDPVPFDKKTRLFGMIKARKKITIRDAVDIVGMEKRDIEVLIYDLVGEGKIEGEFQEGDVFLITSDVDAAIKNLDESFRVWKAGGEKRAGKKD